uniref:SH3 domain-containing protein n=1 Tax=Leptobrachium leishanense TaxID=445787 RepID=A0A8C5WMJ2_9ANUR
MLRVIFYPVFSKKTLATANELSLLIARMQSNADQVERNILQTNQKLKQVRVTSQKQRPSQSFQHQQENAKCLKESELLLKDLFLDVDKVKRHGHPQAKEIEKDIHQLHDRVSQECAEYRDVYEKLNISPPEPTVNWPQILDNKKVHLDGQYGPSLADVERQIAEHNLLEHEIDEYDTKIRNLPQDSARIKSQYQELKDYSWRGQHLSSLYNHLHGCTKELMFLNDEQNKVLKQDWSDTMPDLPGTRRQYERFKKEELLPLEEQVNELLDDGDRMVELKHPASSCAHNEALKGEWQNFLNLCIGKENHLKNAEDYKKFQDDADTASQIMANVNKNLSSPGTYVNELQLEKEDKQLLQAEKILDDLRQRSPDIMPIKQRRTRPKQPIKMDTICDWDSGDVQLSKGDTCILIDNSKKESWVVQSPAGKTMDAPASCFVIPPPDLEAVDTLKRLDGELSETRKKKAAVQNALRSKPRESTKPNQLAPAATINAKDKSLTQMCILPDIAYQKDAARKECESFLSKKPSGPAASQLPSAIARVNNKYNDVKALTSFYGEEAKASLNLENQIKKTDDMISGYERVLANDGVIPYTPSALQDKVTEIQKTKRDLVDKQDNLLKLNRSLKDTELACNALQSNTQEHSPDLPRQRTEVQRLNDRYHAIADQLDQREKILRDANLPYQQYKSSSDNLDSWLRNLPRNQVNSSDSPSQVNYKLQSQKVSRTRASMYDVKRQEEKKNQRHTRYRKYTQDGVQLSMQSNLRSENIRRSAQEGEILSKQLDEEKKKVSEVQQALEENRTRLLLLKTQRPVERLEEKEMVQYYREPRLESELVTMKSQAENAYKDREKTQSEIAVISKRLVTLENQRKSSKPLLLTKEVTEIERDPNLESQASSLRQEIKHMKDDNNSFSSELDHLKQQLLILEQKQPKINEKVVLKEVVKLERDPEIVKATRTLQMQIDDDSFQRKTIQDNILKMRRRTEELEKTIGLVEPKVIVKEVKKVEQDPEILRQAAKLKTLIEEERRKSVTITREMTELQSKYIVVDKQKPKVEIKERVNEIFVVEPETEKEIARLKRALKDISGKYSFQDTEINTINNNVFVLRSQKPVVEYKEVVQEVVKLEQTPEVVKEIERLRGQINDLGSSNNMSQDQKTKLTKERDEWKRERSKVETKTVNKEVVKYEDDPVLMKELERLRQEAREESQKRRAKEDVVYDLQSKYLLLERRKPEERVVVQEVVNLQKDPKIAEEHRRLSRTLDEEVSNRRRLEREVQQLRNLVEEKERLLNFQEERDKKLAAEKELRQITHRIKEIEERPPPVQEKIVMEEVVKVEKDPVMEQSANALRNELDAERSRIMNIERECKNLQVRVDIMQREKSLEKTIYKEVIRVEKDKVLQNERARLRELYNKERNARQLIEDENRRLKEKIDRVGATKQSWSKEETELQKARAIAQQEKLAIEHELLELRRQQQQKSVFLNKESELLTQKAENVRQKKMQVEHELSLLEANILSEKDSIYEKERQIRDLQTRANREERNQETQMRETNVSTKISILDPDTGKEMSPYEAYKRGIIDRGQYIQLQELECDWEEISTTGSSGEISVLLDKKSGKQYSIEDALRTRKITKEELQMYRDGRLPISEFALLVAGENKSQSLSIGSIIGPKSPSSQSSTHTFVTHSATHSAPKSFQDDSFPIAAIYDTTVDSKCPIRSAITRKMIDPVTGQKLLEAQAATGGIIDILNKDRVSVHKAMDKGMIDSSNPQSLLKAQKAFTGVEDPVTKKRLSVGEAVQKGLMSKETALPYLQVQYLTGGLIDTKKTGRIPLSEAVAQGMVTQEMANMIQDEANYERNIIDPITKQKLNYKEAMAECRRDPASGLLLLQAASEAYQPAVYRPVNTIPSMTSYRY